MSTLTLSDAIIIKLKEADIVGDRVYAQVPANPTYPHIRYGLPFTNPYETSCAKGGEHDVTIHVFAKGPGTVEIGGLVDSVVNTLDDSELAIEPLGFYGIDWQGTQILPDGDDTSSYHGVVRFTAVTLDNGG